MRSRILVLTLLLATACSTSQEMTVTQDGLDLREEARDDAAVVEKLALGTRVKVHDAPFWVNSDWHRIDTKGGKRWTKLEGLAPYPLRGETRFVRLVEVPVHATRDPNGRVTESLKLGDEIQLLAEEPAGDAEYHGVIRGGSLRGYVDEFGLAKEKPLTASLLASSSEFLKKGDFGRAKQLAEAAFEMAEKTGRSGALVEAITTAETDPASLKDELINFTEKAASEAPPSKGSLGYVIAYRAPVREGADERDDILTMLPADAAVNVLNIQGQWAQVELVAKRTPWMAVELGDLAKVSAGETAALSPAQRSGRSRGFMTLSALQSKHSSATEHLAKVKALAQDEHAEQRLELLKRALTIAEPKEVPAVAPALIDEAFQQQRYRLAVAAAVRLVEEGHGTAQKPRGSGWKIETVTSIYGCSGSPLESQIEQVDFEPTGDISKPSGSVCALVTGLSSPCDVCLSDLSEYDAEERQHVLRNKVAVDGALTNHEDVITNYLKATSRLEDAFPRPSRMKVTVRAASGSPPGRLFVFELPLEVERYESQLGVKPLFREARVSEVALPESAADGRWEYWMSTLQWEDSAHGAIFSSDPKSAWKSVHEFARALAAKPKELLTRNEAAGVVYSLHISEACGRCPNRRK
ncbi:SH3 domain-containing protein [Hyalangium versicolor]|uniref:SH3 domain-containing protein n=1 Tax=Hyalangium versicolor TaxID=2861190 RepID=UPI001CCE8A49|nr:SH3 domain-containing protein [Hyalangium versicolor]